MSENTVVEKQAKAVKVCPFCPFIESTQRSFTCIGCFCQMWDKKRKDCGLKR